MNSLEDAGGLTDLQDLSFDELASSSEAAGIVDRFTRSGSEESEPIRVAAFNSYI